MDDNDLTVSATDVGDAIVAAAAKPDFLSGLLAALTACHRSAEDLLERCDVGERRLIACHAGCDHCCVVNVSVSLLEGVAIVRFLDQLAPAEKEIVLTRLERLWGRIRGLDDEERLALRNRCAFLNDEGLCRIYPARPLFCRSVTSIDPEACQKAVYCKLRGESQTLLMYQYQKRLYEAFYRAIADGLERAGMDGRSFQLSGLVRYLAKRPQSGAVLLSSRTLSWADLYA